MFLAFSLWYMFMPSEVLGFIMVGNYRVPHYTILSSNNDITTQQFNNNQDIVGKPSNLIRHDA